MLRDKVSSARTMTSYYEVVFVITAGLLDGSQIKKEALRNLSVAVIFR